MQQQQHVACWLSLSVAMATREREWERERQFLARADIFIVIECCCCCCPFCCFYWIFINGQKRWEQNCRLEQRSCYRVAVCLAAVHSGARVRDLCGKNLTPSQLDPFSACQPTWLCQKSLDQSFLQFCSTVQPPLTAYATAGWLVAWYGWLTGQAKSPLKSIFYATQSRDLEDVCRISLSVSPSVCIPVHLSVSFQPTEMQQEMQHKLKCEHVSARDRATKWSRQATRLWSSSVQFSSFEWSSSVCLTIYTVYT